MKDEAVEKRLKDMGSGVRYMACVIDLADEEKGPQVIELPKSVIEEIWNIMVDEELGIGDVTDPEKGYDLVIDRTGTGLSVRYSVKPKPAPSSIKKMEWLDQIPNLDLFVKKETNENLLRAFRGEMPLETTLIEAPEGGEPLALPGAGEGEWEPPTTDTTEAPAAKKVEPVLPPTETPVGLPKCFGSFNEENATCLDCVDQDECEAKMLDQKAKLTTPAPVEVPPVETSAASAPAAEATTTATPAAEPESLDSDSLVKELEEVISRKA